MIHALPIIPNAGKKSNVISTGETSGGRSPWLGIAGLLISLGGLGLGYYTLRSRKS